MGDYLVRSAEEGDLDQVLALFKALNPDDPDLDPGRAADIYARILRSDETDMLVLDVGGRLVSTCTISIMLNLSRGGRPYAVIENVSTLADHRLKGYGKIVMRAAIDRARAVDCYKVMLATGSKRPSTLGFYESLGFTRGKTAFEIKRL